MVRPSLLVFADDWGRHPSSCQHLMRRLLTCYDIHWVNTIGMRAPRLDLATVRRGLEKLRHWRRSSPATTPLPSGLTVHNPRMWPWFSTSFSRWLNRKLLTAQLNKLIQTLGQPPVVVTTVPVVADLIGNLPVSSWVYYCVDDFGQWPGLDQKTLQRLDDELIRRADVIVAVSENLQDRVKSLGRDSDLLTHGVDLDFWSHPTILQPLPDSIKSPLVVFWGVIDRRMDVRLLEELSRKMTTGSIVLVGPEQNPAPELRSLPGVSFTGSLPFDQLPALAQRASVLVMPYADLPVTRAMQPLKLKEYLATNKPVVVSDLPSTRAWADCLDVATSPTDFADRVLRRINGTVPPDQQAARHRLREESWQAKAERFESLALQPRANKA